ncbi:MAG: DUF4157 domain-containing protein [Limnohabitans sp.]|nr:DUF4157 domain-containing protein [Limnohabitans sp.]
MSAFKQNQKSNSSYVSTLNTRQGEDFFGVQAKLNIGKSNDKYEVEADRVADKVVTNQQKNNSNSFFSPNPILQSKQDENIRKKDEKEIQEKQLAENITPVVQLQAGDNRNLQQKCNACENEDKKKVQTKKNNNLQANSNENTDLNHNSNLERNLNSSKGSGSPLSVQTKQEMESSFGVDFSNIRVHNDSNAVQMNRELGAQAFANGSDIYFNEGKYNPSSNQGKHLLAHELTHTIQQGNKSVIQRATDPNFAITGLSPLAAGTPNSIFFEMGSSSVATEEPKVDTLAANTTQNYDLEGFASEEGTDAVNSDIAQRRIVSVSNMLRSKGHTGRHNPINSFRKGNNRINYRDLRKVEVRNAGDTPTELDCNATALNPHPEVTNCNTSFTTAHPLALAKTTDARDRMDGATGVERTRIENAVTFFFGNAGLYNTILGHLRNHVIQVNDQPNTVVCHNSCDNGCEGASAYMPGTTGPGAILTLCPPFINQPDLNSRVTTLLHEAFHATTGLATSDLAYDAERGFTMIDPSIALRNTDTYVAFIEEIVTPGSIIGGSSLRDVIDASITGTQLTDLRRVMAFLEKWVIESTAEVSSLYDMIIEARRLNNWSGISFPYYEDTMVFVSTIFGLTAPATVPSESDQTAVAGINFRLMAMDQFLWETNIQINKDNTQSVQFANGPSEPLIVNDAFLSSGQHAMVYLLVEKLVEANSRIASSERPKYVRLIEEIRIHAGHSAP